MLSMDLLDLPSSYDPSGIYGGLSNAILRAGWPDALGSQLVNSAYGFCRLTYGTGGFRTRRIIDMQGGMYALPAAEYCKAEFFVYSIPTATVGAFSFRGSIRPCEQGAPGSPPTVSGGVVVAASTTANVGVPPGAYAFDFQCTAGYPYNAASARQVLAYYGTAALGYNAYMIRDQLNGLFQPPGPQLITGNDLLYVQNYGSLNAQIVMTYWIGF